MVLKTLTSAALTLVLLFGSYAWYVAYATCPIPVTYRLGTLDASFGLSEAEARAAIADAESLWEDATGINLFTYDEAGKLPVNFVFDERQQLTDIEGELSGALNELRDRSTALQATYEALESSYVKEKDRYDALVVEYERDLRAYNDEVARWNETGGAPSEVYETLQAEQERLAMLSGDIEATRSALNERIDAVNDAATKAKEAVDAYNAQVGTYNDTFAEASEFTQGDYQGTHINIYQFSSREELVLVLAHELGHALGIDHVENEASLMYQLMGAQALETGATEEDIAAFSQVCGDGSLISKLRFW